MPSRSRSSGFPAGGPAPGVVLVHGGCWRAQYGRDLEYRVAADLAVRGLAVWNVEYRRLDCDGDWPAPLDDVVAAAAALPREIDPARIALAGHSAGGHLALLAANRVSARGVLAQAPVSDLPLAAELGACAGAVERLLEQGAPSPIDEPPAARCCSCTATPTATSRWSSAARYAAGATPSTSSWSAAGTWSTSIPRATPAGWPATGSSACSPELARDVSRAP